MIQATVVIMAGGTGGHVFPALAVAHEMVNQGIKVTWLGTQKGLEAKLVPQHGFEIDYISVSGLRGNGLKGWLMAPFRLVYALMQSIAVYRRRQPDLVLGMGGFVTGPGGVAAKLLGKILVIHEQNAIAGLTNRLLSIIADRILQAFPQTFRPARKLTSTGNPVRKEIMELDEPVQRMQTHDGAIRLLVVGGSLGALALNQTIPEAIAKLDANERPLVRHQCGASHIDNTRTLYQQYGVDASVYAFIDDMAEAYEWADLVVCRSGALTVSELASAGIAALLIPFPFAVDDHQYFNGRYLLDGDAAQIIRQNKFNPDWLATYLKTFCRDSEDGRKQLLAMAANGRKLAKNDATTEVVSICVNAINKESKHG
jgi:UDP-N-acetylglucosamine--N-acetylmuramyl-(pentapeptide) pyrophosphoryl-undecaprenol N-acetylglucosamine transferase